ncbi:hypothetical protein FKZ61_013630 [Litorilinea aerophila]|uniref:Uncharacterized protein n=1 Tax=Litorilinea aerophila TaxID=1204385 RepID=A0A540VEK4_9CHLR|nr:hypothetical protein [Litorilinea aerophila]MCC9077144.1 hypothetical protein [Litorilinea aerophila]OUC06373.1 hypothetical protein RY27_21455 [Litorilinea aerophila]
MSIISIIQEFPPELQPSMLKLIEALERDLREKYAVRREDFDALRATVQELAEAQRRTEQRVEELAEAQRRTEQRVEELAEAQRRTEQRVEELAEAQRHTEQQVSRLEEAVSALAEAQRRTEQRIEALTERMDRLVQTMERFQDALAKNTGWRLEQSYREKAYAYFGRVLRRVRIVPIQEIEEQLETLPPADRDELLLLDLIVRGRPRDLDVPTDVYLAVEVSSVVDRNDVERARRRAAILRSLGHVAVPVVAGENVSQGGMNRAREDHVALFQDGTYQFWDEALQHALNQ